MGHQGVHLLHPSAQATSSATSSPSVTSTQHSVRGYPRRSGGKWSLSSETCWRVAYDESRKEVVIRKVRDERKKLKAGRKLTPDEIEALIAEGLGKSL